MPDRLPRVRPSLPARWSSTPREPPASKRTPTVVEWHAGRLSSAALAEALGDELLAEMDRFTASQRRHPQTRYGPASHVEEWWEWYREELDLTGFSAEDYTVLLEHLAPRLPKWGLRRPPTPLEPTEPTVGRGWAARLYLDVDGAFSPICMGPQHDGDLVWMRGPSVARGQAPDTGWTWRVIGGPTPIPVELARQLADLDTTAVEVVWLTTWHEMANSLLTNVGVDARFRNHPRSDDIGANTKRQFVVNELRRDPVPFVWVDDREITPSTWRWAASCGVPNLLVHSNRYHGVTPTTWSSVIAWLHEHSGVDLSRLGGVIRQSSTGGAGRDA